MGKAWKTGTVYPKNTIPKDKAKLRKKCGKMMILGIFFFSKKKREQAKLPTLPPHKKKDTHKKTKDRRQRQTCTRTQQNRIEWQVLWFEQ